MPRPIDAVLNELSGALGQPLPPSYVDFVNHHDGATPGGNSIAISYNEVSVSRFIPSNEALKLAESIDGFPSSVIPIAEDDCGNYFYINPQCGAVFFWDHELEEDDAKIANDMSEFVDRLAPFDPTSIKLQPGQVKSAWIDPAFKPEF
ncbi:SMI1/KNR4 family protein [Sphingobium yanoikuyae]|jgi:hypothetical protein|uniref:SMI1/KNR4 family protein n=2 Tax=Sphingobium yanoikuyae TaxID=13690 RepID=A0A430BJJ0_SPHYA|nr:SMI1/KNR4 family protein [Sphingobium yanoikuyae]